jgi:cytochrome c
MSPDREFHNRPSSAATSPWRVLLAIVPALVIIVTAAGLIGTWTTAPEREPSRTPPPIETDAGTGGEQPIAKDIPAAARQAFDAKAVVALLATADPDKGAGEFRRCATCHSVSPGTGSKIGPNLWNVVGRRKAALPDFAYSEALASKGGTWTEEDLAAYLHNPRGYAPGTKMAFRGIEDANRIADIIVYLQGLSNAPLLSSD